LLIINIILIILLKECYY